MSRRNWKTETKETVLLLSKIGTQTGEIKRVVSENIEPISETTIQKWRKEAGLNAEIPQSLKKYHSQKFLVEDDDVDEKEQLMRYECVFEYSNKKELLRNLFDILLDVAFEEK